MDRRKWSLVFLAGAVFVAVRWVYPRIARFEVRFEVPVSECVLAAQIEIQRNGARLKSLRINAPRKIAAYETSLHRGEYEALVRLDCASGDVRDGKPRPIVVSDEAAFYLHPPPPCLCE